MIVTSFTKIILCEKRGQVCNVWIFSQLFIYKMDLFVTSGDYVTSAFFSRNLLVWHGRKKKLPLGRQNIFGRGKTRVLLVRGNLAMALFCKRSVLWRLLSWAGVYNNAGKQNTLCKQSQTRALEYGVVMLYLQCALWTSQWPRWVITMYHVRFSSRPFQKSFVYFSQPISSNRSHGPSWSHSKWALEYGKRIYAWH